MVSSKESLRQFTQGSQRQACRKNNVWRHVKDKLTAIINFSAYLITSPQRGGGLFLPIAEKILVPGTK